MPLDELKYICAEVFRLIDMDKDFFSMTRRERRGTIVILVMILVFFGASWAWKHTSRSSSETITAVTDLQAFEAQTDSFQSSMTQPKKKNREAKGKKRDSRRKKQPRRSQPKPPSSPRRVDPVPQF